ncbi:MAG: hypothetical protein RLO51_05715 [Thalassobaculum sp.]|uniref:hypothetical protein n=1 Tax=Thalassobaculum sp. TaxID=2022740 RepID=UPI0032EC89EA
MTDPLLPLAPAPVDDRQAALTAEHIGDPAALTAYFEGLRREVDPGMAARHPSFNGKPYPLGRCREIRDAVLALLLERVNAPRDPMEAAISTFIRSGGVGKKTWGVLRNTYFQNAMQLGAWYVDVANDTVVPSKPPVEVLPAAGVDMVAVRDYAHFADIARRYWGAEVFRNSVFPRLAAFFPLIVVYPTGGAEPAVASDQVTELTRRSAFRPSLDALAAFPDPPVAVAAKLLRSAGDDPLLQPVGDPSACVAADIAAGRHEDPEFRRRCVAAWRLVAAPTAPR